MPFLSFSRASSRDGADHHSHTRSNSNTHLQNGLSKGKNSGVSSKPTVTFIPSQIDALALTTPLHHRIAQTPSKLLFNDLATLLHCFMTCVTPTFSWNNGLFASRNLKSFLKDPLDVRDLLCQCILGIIEIWALILGAPAILILPGAVWMMGMTFFATVVMGVGWVLNGGSGRGNGGVVKCCGGKKNARRGVRAERERMRARECAENGVEFVDERWIFVNGVMTSKQALQSHINRLSRTFNRPILGIHQPTYGLLLDLLSSLLLRTLSGFPTPTANTLYDQLRCACLDSSIDKVVLLAHGTGGIVISIVLDRLFADLPAGRECLGKIEVYTFGNASGWMGNPNRVLGTIRGGTRNATGDGNSTRRNEETEKTISHIEHYAKETDILARWGILHNIREALDNRYAGRVFVMNGQGSSLMGDGYLDQIWPVCHEARCDGSGKSCSNDCHIHSSRCEGAQGCSSNCDGHARGKECGNRDCRSQGKVCNRLDCDGSYHVMVCTKSCHNSSLCDHKRECETHGSKCRGCEMHGPKCDGKENLVCVKGCKQGRDCTHLRECQTHGKTCTGQHEQNHHHHTLLDEVVKVDVDTAVKREFAAQVASMPQKMMTLNLNRNITQNGYGQKDSHSGHNHMYTYTQSLNYSSPTKHHNMQNNCNSPVDSTSPDISPKNTSPNREREKELKRASWSTLDTLGIDSIGQARIYATECEGMTVRQLSRLWRYVGGERPGGEGVGISNGGLNSARLGAVDGVVNGVVGNGNGNTMRGGQKVGAGK